ncbi:MAG TPA: lysylphosphatidylglycerol synthase domain-containing protein [Candidatus Dormibacteraeota bacterium]|nr:lysylphosphatidylglycerol synthase domain-containing protein [Candidatus Dormibacteraeota bacterium]
MKKNLRIALGILIVLLTIAEVAYYLSKHTYLLRQLAHLSPAIIVWILLLYGVMLGALVLIMQASLRICRVAMGARDNLLLNMYSLFINFFLIGQAGPGLRAAYLKKYYGLKVRKYLFVTLIYYACYSIVAALLMLAGSSAPWFWSVLAAVALGGISFGAVFLYMRRSKMDSDGLSLNTNTLSYLMLATVFQAIIQISIYFMELHSVNSHVTLKQTMAYTGVANFALFVGLTPGAIGIRESFLVFSQRLHHISSANIVSANIIDRSVYLLFLGILFVAIASLHVKRKLSVE